MLGGFFVIVATHFHYSVDVYIGFLLTSLVWRVYFMTANAPTHMINPTTPWDLVIRWLEGFELPKILVNRDTGQKMMVVDLPEISHFPTRSRARQALMASGGGQEANHVVFCVLQKKFHAVIFKGVGQYF